jgi:hypothetical protein
MIANDKDKILKELFKERVGVCESYIISDRKNKGFIDFTYAIEAPCLQYEIAELIAKYFKYLGCHTKINRYSYTPKIEFSSLQKTIWHFRPFRWWANYRVRKIEKWGGI